MYAKVLAVWLRFDRITTVETRKNAVNGTSIHILMCEITRQCGAVTPQRESWMEIMIKAKEKKMPFKLKRLRIPLIFFFYQSTEVHPHRFRAPNSQRTSVNYANHNVDSSAQWFNATASMREFSCGSRVSFFFLFFVFHFIFFVDLYVSCVFRFFGFLLFRIRSLQNTWSGHWMRLRCGSTISRQNEIENRNNQF